MQATKSESVKPFARGIVPCNSPDIASVTLVRELPWWMRSYTGPWLLAYPWSAYMFYGAYDKYLGSIGKDIVHSLAWRNASMRDVSAHMTICCSQNGRSYFVLFYSVVTLCLSCLHGGVSLSKPEVKHGQSRI